MTNKDRLPYNVLLGVGGFGGDRVDGSSQVAHFLSAVDGSAIIGPFGELALWRDVLLVVGGEGEFWHAWKHSDEENYTNLRLRTQTNAPRILTQNSHSEPFKLSFGVLLAKIWFLTIDDGADSGKSIVEFCWELAKMLSFSMLILVTFPSSMSVALQRRVIRVAWTTVMNGLDGVRWCNAPVSITHLSSQLTILNDPEEEAESELLFMRLGSSGKVGRL